MNINLTSKWKSAYQSICLIEHFKDGKKLGSGTGFKINGKIITNNHVYYNGEATKTIITFVESDCTTIRLKKEYNNSEFRKLLLAGDPKENWDFAILDASHSDFNLIPSLYISKNYKIEIGSKIYFLGFPLLKNNLTINRGIISSKFVLNNVKYIQISGNVNNGNSGGALFDFETDQIIGIVTRKNTGLSKRFDDLVTSFNENIIFLKKSQNGGKAIISGIDPIQSLEIIQNQFKKLCEEIVRSSNVGIGYAFELDEVKKELNI